MKGATMDQAYDQNRSGCPCGPMCDRIGAPVRVQALATTHRHPAPNRSQRLLAAATIAATFVVALNALVQALNVLAAWWGHGR